MFLMIKHARKIIVRGTNVMKARADIALLNIGILTSNENATQAQEGNRIRANQMITALVEAGIARNDIETTSYTVFPRYTDHPEGALISTYEVRHMFQITVRDIEKAGIIYDVAFQNGANISEAIVFKVSNEEALYRRVLQFAVQDAYQKATAISKVIGVPLNPIPLKVEEIKETIFYGATTFSLQESATPTPIEPRNIEIVANVQVEFTY